MSKEISYDAIKKNLKTELFQAMDFSREMKDEEIRELIDEKIMSIGRETYIPLAEKKRLGKELFFSIRKLDILQELIEDEEVTEIMVNGPERIFLEKRGKIFQWENKFESREKLEDVIQQIVAKSNRVVNETSPIVDARLENGSRVNVVLAPVALNGPILTIRRFPENPLSMEDFIRMGSITKEAADFLKCMVTAGYNIFISGGTGSGKTTFLNVLSGFIPKEERIITIEDSAELQLADTPNLVSMETRNANVEGCQEITIRDLIKTSLRMRPDRIIVGEVRGGEALDLLQALNTGHDGSLSTGHSNSSRDMLSRLETMVLMGMELPLPAIRRQIASGVDIIVHLGRLRDHTRKVLEIVEITGFDQGEILTAPLYEFKEEFDKGEEAVKGALVKTGKLMHRDKLMFAGMGTCIE
ncbi:MAG: CpaF family protein [Lachnospiraceae bacterium]|nr:CpaF family protein [Lachnospiraceae bacterium]